MAREHVENRPIPANVRIEQYIVGAWCQGDDGTREPTAVAIQYDITVGGVPMTFLLKLKTREEVTELIAGLQDHRDRVWPVPKSTGTN